MAFCACSQGLCWARLKAAEIRPREVHQTTKLRDGQLAAGTASVQQCALGGRKISPARASARAYSNKMWARSRAPVRPRPDPAHAEKLAKIHGRLSFRRTRLVQTAVAPRLHGRCPRPKPRLDRRVSVAQFRLPPNVANSAVRPRSAVSTTLRVSSLAEGAAQRQAQVW